MTDTTNADEIEICPHCDGSGESVADQSCQTCCGSGGVPKTDKSWFVPRYEGLGDDD